MYILFTTQFVVKILINAFKTPSLYRFNSPNFNQTSLNGRYYHSHKTRDVGFVSKSSQTSSPTLHDYYNSNSFNSIANDSLSKSLFNCENIKNQRPQLSGSDKKMFTKIYANITLGIRLFIMVIN